MELKRELTDKEKHAHKIVSRWGALRGAEYGRRWQHEQNIVTSFGETLFKMMVRAGYEDFII